MDLRGLNNGFVISLKQGKEYVFRTVFDAYFELLVIFAKAYVVNEDVAKDIVQEVFTNLWKVRLSLDDDLNLKAYLYQATRNRCLNYLKRIKLQNRYEKKAVDEYNDILLNYQALEKLNFDTLSFNELLETLNQAIEGLPEKCREVFELSRYDGMKNKEIAEKLGISIKAVENHISRALKFLKSKLSEYYSGSLILFLLRKLPQPVTARPR